MLEVINWVHAGTRAVVLRLSLALVISVCAAGYGAQAAQPDEVLSDPALETRARTLSRELRCMVCQNQSIDDSDAPLARDLRLLVRERLKAGDSDAQVLDFLVARYGEFVLLDPRMSWRTAALWAAPGAILLIGAIVIVLTFRRRGPAETPEPLATDEERRLDEIAR